MFEIAIVMIKPTSPPSFSIKSKNVKAEPYRTEDCLSFSAFNFFDMNEKRMKYVVYGGVAGS